MPQQEEMRVGLWMEDGKLPAKPVDVLEQWVVLHERVWSVGFGGSICGHRIIELFELQRPF